MAEIVTDVIIDASVDEVWRVLSNFSDYAEWNPYIRSMSGSLATGASMNVTSVVADRGESTSHPTVTMYRPAREIRMLERPMLPGLLDSEHGLKLEPLGPEQVRFVHWRSTSGLLAPILGGPSDKLRGQLEAMNRALKDRTERGLVSHEASANGTDPVVTARPDVRAAVGQPA